MAIDPLTAALDVGKTIVDKIWPDAGESERRRIETIVTLTTAQLQINQAEAGHASIFVAGWRPFIGWVGGAALAYTYIGYPLALWACALWVPTIIPPKLGVDEMLWELLFGLLGLGGLRTVEKIKRVTR